MDTGNHDNEMDPSNISLNFFTETGYNPVSINTGSHDSNDSTPIPSVGPSEPSLASPFPEDESKRDAKKGLFTGYVTGKAMEVAKRRNLIERIERARELGLLNVSIPQLSELSMTQLSMFLRRLFKMTPGLRDFVSDEVVQTIFEDFEPRSSSAMGAADDVPNEDFLNVPTVYESGAETEPEYEYHNGSDEENSGVNKAELPVSQSIQPAYYRIRRRIMEADNCIALQIRKVIEKRDRFLTNICDMDSFEFELPKQTGDAEQDSQTCLRCRPLIKRVKRKLSKTIFPTNRQSAPSPTRFEDNLEKVCSFDFNDTRIRNVTTMTRLNSEAMIEDYLHNMGNIPLYVPVKSQTAYNNKGKTDKEYYGFVSDIKKELTGYPHVLPPVQSSGKKRKAVPVLVDNNGSDDEEESNHSEGLLLRVKNKQDLKALKRKQTGNTANTAKTKKVEPMVDTRKVSPLKIRRPLVPEPHPASTYYTSHHQYSIPSTSLQCQTEATKYTERQSTYSSDITATSELEGLFTSDQPQIQKSYSHADVQNNPATLQEYPDQINYGMEDSDLSLELKTSGMDEHPADESKSTSSSSSSTSSSSSSSKSSSSSPEHNTTREESNLNETRGTRSSRGSGSSDSSSSESGDESDKEDNDEEDVLRESSVSLNITGSSGEKNESKETDSILGPETSGLDVVCQEESEDKMDGGGQVTNNAGNEARNVERGIEVAQQSEEDGYKSDDEGDSQEERDEDGVKIEGASQADDEENENEESDLERDVTPLNDNADVSNAATESAQEHSEIGDVSQLEDVELRANLGYNASEGNEDEFGESLVEEELDGVDGNGEESNVETRDTDEKEDPVSEE
ncbi:unnamed protein product [Bursaphelenchus xylophilus]|uniref:(pine wood nematode) hypothetical protein n=1 Tax=Bursaphelenchus xylophilus TaxID=6326 RepID=A0A1I7RQU8_BURXY|nr:unnamed protein product [Bursaphelenchus xylophilus]CAG9130681.1 unnamed protein product [Bursaphelenchus xylophilus]